MSKVIWKYVVIVGALFFLAGAESAVAAKLLSDSQLDRITAGDARIVENSPDVFRMDFMKQTASGKAITGDLSFTVIKSIDAVNIGSLNLSGNAQSNLSSLININAVNSPVSVLLNLNINIDSQVGSMTQINMAIPVAPPMLPSILGNP